MAAATHGPRMPPSATILMVRHAEKPDKGTGLAPTGRQRALAYPSYFESYSPDHGSPPLKIDYIFAAANSDASCRPQLTIMPTAVALNLPIDDATADDDYADLAKQIRHGSQYADSVLLICWHHGKLLDLAAELGVARHKLPREATWPKTWPGGPPPAGTPDVYGWMLVIVSDAHGEIDTSRTRCINERLMPDDNANPPDGAS